MEKQSLIKSYWVLFLVLVLLASSNHAMAQTPSATSSSTTMQTIEKTNNDILPLIISIFALAASGSAIALTIFKNKKINERIEADNEKYSYKLKSLESKYTDLLTAQTNSLSNQQYETIGRDFKNPSNPNVYLEGKIDDLSVRISELEDKLQPSRNHEQSINYAKNIYLSKQNSNLDTDIDPFSETTNKFQSDITQPLENIAYVELVNTYNTNPKQLEQRAIRVSEPTDSINRRHTDSSQKIVLEKANNSNYWVIHDDVGVDFWLLPKSNLKIDRYRYETTKALFECNGYQPEYSTFKLVKPAKVIPLSVDEQTWQLEEPGILEFAA